MGKHSKTCDVCGSKLAKFVRGKNPDETEIYEYVCPTPDRHKTSTTIGRPTHRGGSHRKRPPGERK